MSSGTKTGDIAMADPPLNRAPAQEPQSRDRAATIRQSGMLKLINPVERAEPFDHADRLFEAFRGRV
jgi:hypothetical protein